MPFRRFRTSLAMTIAAALFAAAPAVAQDPTPTLDVTPYTLRVGGTATITYFNPALAGQTVTIDIDNGRRRDPQTDTVQITLDATGHGMVTWTVPNWSLAKFNAPDVGEVGCVIEQ